MNPPVWESSLTPNYFWLTNWEQYVATVLCHSCEVEIPVHFIFYTCTLSQLLLSFYPILHYSCLCLLLSVHICSKYFVDFYQLFLHNIASIFMKFVYTGYDINIPLHIALEGQLFCICHKFEIVHFLYRHKKYNDVQKN